MAGPTGAADRDGDLVAVLLPDHLEPIAQLGEHAVTIVGNRDGTLDEVLREEGIDPRPERVAVPALEGAHQERARMLAGERLQGTRTSILPDP
ncbi:hypothetical protein WMF11_23130 [Sorangium sp. So ce295]|uniref:hypothetical protein n=1 Tax=Sorangium sp. So ce295 TaxID=3133295 RepID=UPI003F610EA4